MAISKRDSAPPQDLFAAPHVEQTGPVVFLTNRYNLLQILSSGMIAPRECYSKYYRDWLECSPGRIPVVRGPISQTLQTGVSGDDETAFPVALELDLEALSSTSVPALGESGKQSSAELGGGTAIAWAPAGAIPIIGVKRIAFRSQSEFDEHRARRYENISPTSVTMAVDRALFENGSTTGDTLCDWLRTLPAVETDQARYNAVDRVSGARCLAVDALPIIPSAIDVVLRLFPDDLSANNAAEEAPRPSAHMAGWVSHGSVLGNGRAAQGDLNARLFNASVETLTKIDRATGWRPVEVIAEIERTVRARKLSKKDEAELSRNLDPIGGILRNERDFKPFKSGVGLDVAKALLLVLLRPEPTRLLGWGRRDTGADAPVLITAAILCGLINGRERLPLDLRPPDLDNLLSTLAAQEFSGPSGQIALVPTLTPTGVTVRGDVDTGAALVSGGRVLVRWKNPPKSATELLLARGTAELLAGELAIEICKDLGWVDCVRSRMIADDGSILISSIGKGKAIAVELRGWPTVAHELNEARFRARLESEGIPVDKEAQVLDRLGRSKTNA